MQTPVIFVIGPPAHGKSTARKLLCDLTGVKGASCSDVIYQFLAARRKITLPEAKALPKEEIRPLLVEIGDFLVGKIGAIAEPALDDHLEKIAYRIPSALIRMLYMSGINIIDGVRRKAELVDARTHLDWNGVRSVVVWVERSQGPVIPDNTELTALDADVVVFNDGTPEELREKLLHEVLEKFFGEQPDIGKEIPILDAPPKPADVVKDDLG